MLADLYGAHGGAAFAASPGAEKAAIHTGAKFGPQPRHGPERLTRA
jgi:hypothetical protein